MVGYCFCFDTYIPGANYGWRIVGRTLGDRQLSSPNTIYVFFLLSIIQQNKKGGYVVYPDTRTQDWIAVNFISN